MNLSKKFICTPNNLELDINFSAHGAGHLIAMSISHGSKEGFKARYSTPHLTKDILEEKVKTFCNNILNFTEDEIQRLLSSESIMPALYARRNLREVRNTSGILVWKKIKA